MKPAQTRSHPTQTPQAVLSQVAPAMISSVVAEDHLLLPPDIAAWRPEKGPARLRSSNRGMAGALVPGALDHDSLVVRHEGAPWIEGQHFVVDPFWGSLGQGPVRETVSGARPTRLTQPAPDSQDLDGEGLVDLSNPPPTVVQLSYRWSERRIDAIGRDRAGQWCVWPGESHLSAPVPPTVPDDHEHVANVFVDHFDQTGLVLFRGPSGGPATEEQLNRLPSVQSALAQQRPLRIACWGDSVTAGGDATTQAKAFPALLQTGLTQAWGQQSVNLRIMAVDGSSTSDWLDRSSEIHDPSHGAGLPGTDLNALLDFRPDLVIAEFVNDASLEPDLWHHNYEHILDLCRSIGADLMLTTPHFTAASWMGDPDIGGHDQRPLTTFLRDFAHQHGLALADISRRWERLYDEGIPYPTLLNNGVNHPDDRGHQLAAAEIAAALGVELRLIGEST